MKEIIGDIFKEPTDVICITSNGDIKLNGRAVMGRGVALQAKKLIPDIDLRLAEHLKLFGNRPGYLLTHNGVEIYSFPVKHHWYEKANYNLIIDSAELMVHIANFTSSMNKIVLPKPGCGNGGLRWDIVKPLIEKILDDRFYIIDLPLVKE